MRAREFHPHDVYGRVAYICHTLKERAQVVSCTRGRAVSTCNRPRVEIIGARAHLMQPPTRTVVAPQALSALYTASVCDHQTLVYGADPSLELILDCHRCQARKGLPHARILKNGRTSSPIAATAAPPQQPRPNPPNKTYESQHSVRARPRLLAKPYTYPNGVATSRFNFRGATSAQSPAKRCSRSLSN